MCFPVFKMTVAAPVKIEQRSYAFRNEPLRYLDRAEYNRLPVDDRCTCTAFVRVQNKQRVDGRKEHERNEQSVYNARQVCRPLRVLGCLHCPANDPCSESAIVHARRNTSRTIERRRNSNPFASFNRRDYFFERNRRITRPSARYRYRFISVAFADGPIIVGVRRFGRPTVKRFYDGHGQFAALGGTPVAPRAAARTKRFSGNDSDQVSEHTFRPSFFVRRRAHPSTHPKLVEFICHIEREFPSRKVIVHRKSFIKKKPSRMNRPRS